jgi:hypothetical protein
MALPNTRVWRPRPSQSRGRQQLDGSKCALSFLFGTGKATHCIQNLHGVPTCLMVFVCQSYSQHEHRGVLNLKSQGARERMERSESLESKSVHMQAVKIGLLPVASVCQSPPDRPTTTRNQLPDMDFTVRGSQME